MKSLNRKLALAALAIAVLATPALAKSHQTAATRSQQQDYTGTQQAQVPHYPNGALRGGAEYDQEDGADFNLGS